ncbi:MAG: aminopeptidase P N-terminal domain-containing protein, partial [Mollicutes bacterium]|nr:aminopeptidase P N-terminal domain-containing protein [Mollicutes bacterium]
MIPKDELNSRRLRFLKGMEPNSVAILFSGEPKIMSLDEDYKFEVNRNFYYLTGIEQENSILLLVKTEGEEKAILFISNYDENKEKWYGKKLTIEEAKEISSINNVLISPSFQPRLESLIKDENYPIKNIYFDSDPELKIGPALFVDGFIKTLSLSYPSLAFKEFNPIITRLRMVKSKYEVCEFVKAIETTRQGIKLVMAETRGGAKEYELVSTFLKAINDDNGYQGESFNTIMASGVNATTLHYPNPQGICKTGELLLMDLGARHNYYCAD